MTVVETQDHAENNSGDETPDIESEPVVDFIEETHDSGPAVNRIYLVS